MEQIYLDNHTTTKPSESVLSEMVPFFSKHWGSPVQPHHMGQELVPYMEKAYKKIYDLIGAPYEDTLVVTSSGAEAINHVVQGVYQKVTKKEGRNHYLTLKIDEAPAILSIESLKELGVAGETIKINEDGRVTIKDVSESITPRTALISLSWASGLTGVINPIKEIASICRMRSIYLHLDASYVLGRHYFDFKEIQPDFLTFSGDLIHAPKGCGILYMKKKSELSPFILGGKEQGGFRAGSFSIPSLVALGQAAFECKEALDYTCMETARLRDQFEEGLMSKIENTEILFRSSQRLPNVSVVAFEKVVAESLLYLLNQRGVYATFGGSNFQKLSYVLEASSIDKIKANSSLSFALSRYTTEEELELSVSIIAEEVAKLRGLSR